MPRMTRIIGPNGKRLSFSKFDDMIGCWYWVYYYTFCSSENNPCSGGMDGFVEYLETCGYYCKRLSRRGYVEYVSRLSMSCEKTLCDIRKRQSRLRGSTDTGIVLEVGLPGCSPRGKKVSVVELKKILHCWKWIHYNDLRSNDPCPMRVDVIANFLEKCGYRLPENHNSFDFLTHLYDVFRCQLI